MAEQSLNIYQKLMLVRSGFRELTIKKSGKNDFKNYDYLQLADFLPQLEELFATHGLLTVTSFPYNTESGEREAVMTIINVENPQEQIPFISQYSDNALNGMTVVQNIGAAQSYLRRYLYLLSVDIAVPDEVDAAKPQQRSKSKSYKTAPTKQKPASPELLTEAELGRLQHRAIENHGENARACLKDVMAMLKVDRMAEITLDQFKTATELIDVWGKEELSR